MPLQYGVPEKSIRLIEAGDIFQLYEFSLAATFCIPNGDKVLDSLGFVITTAEGIIICHTGDTDYHPFLHYIKKHEVDIMMPCITGKYGNMNLEQTFILTETIDPAIVMPTHFDMFEMSYRTGFIRCIIRNNKHTECIISVIGKPIHFNKLKEYIKK